MASITIRDIPESVLEKVRVLSKRDRRSMNSELLTLLEKGLNDRTDNPAEEAVTPEIQAEMWRMLAGAWIDERSTEEIVADIYTSRTKGRSVSL